MTDQPSIWARIFGRRYEDLDGCIVLMWRGKQCKDATAGVKECGTCAHKAHPLGYGPCRACRYSGYPNWQPETNAGVTVISPQVPGDHTPMGEG